jgi:predicted GNAT family acetyltransferase
MIVKRLASKEDAQNAYPCATESPSPFWVDGLPLSRQWLAENLGHHVEGFHLEDDDQVIGHIYWVPSENALVPYRIEDHVAYIYCEYVQSEHQGRGGMRLLFNTLTEDLRRQGYKGVLVGATEYKDYMHHSHYSKRGFQVIHESDGGKLMYLPLTQETIQVEPLSPSIPEHHGPGVEVLIIGSKFCPVGSSAVLSLRKVVQELEANARLTEIPASQETLEIYGVGDGIFVNGHMAFFGPATEEQIKAKLKEALGSSPLASS